MTPRGIRNHNPGNIRISASEWRGKVVPSGDPEFETFSAPAYGIRAMARLLLTYQRKHGLGTVRGLINRWAPPNENATGAYVAAVTKACGVDPDEYYDLDNLTKLVAIVSAVIRHENGIQPYSTTTILEGCAMALVRA